MERAEWIVVVIAACIFLGTAFSPPPLMDDVDAVHAQIAANMVRSGDWVTPRLNGVAYLEKSPLGYWLTASSYSIFGINDWAARLPLALAVIGLCWVTLRFGRWAFDRDAGLYAGLVLSTCIGLFLFTRILIPDAILTLAITMSMWSFLRSLDPDEPRPRLWATILALSLAAGLLLKGLIAVVFPCTAALVYLAVTGQLFLRSTWRKLHVFSGALIAALVPLPWFVIATLRNPPFFDFTMHSGPGQYHGFFWFYFINEHVLRFLNLRYPRDYNTVPRLWFWLLHVVWLFPWSFYIPALIRSRFKPGSRGRQVSLLAVCWIGVVLLFFTLSTTQEYYSMPVYPAIALLLGSAMSGNSVWIRRGTTGLLVVAALAAIVISTILWQVRGIPTPGDISSALTQHPELYTLSLGHMGDLTLRSFAYLRLELALAAVAAVVGTIGMFIYRKQNRRAFLSAALMMLIFFHAARLALITFNPYLGSKPLAEALMNAPPGKLIEADAYYAFSSVFFYTQRTALLWNGRVDNLEYGSYAPGAPDVFIDDGAFQKLWHGPEQYYLLARSDDLPRIRELVGESSVHAISTSGGKCLLTNRP